MNLIEVINPLRQYLARKLDPRLGFSIFGGARAGRLGLLDHQGDVGEMIKAFRSLVFACINVRAKAVANAGQAGKFQVLIEKGVDEFTDVPVDHPLVQLLRSPNPHMTRWEWWYLTSSYLDLAGNSYSWIARDRLNVPRALWPLPSQRVKIIPGNPRAGEPLIKAYEVDWGLGDAQVIPEADIVQLKHPNPGDPYFYGSSLVMRAAAEIDLDWFITNHQREFFKNDATPAGIVTFPQVLNPDVRKAFEENWLQKFQRKPGQTGYLEGGATYTNIMNQKELDYIQSAGVNIKKVQSVCGVPDSKLMLEENIQARATLETLDYNFQKETIEPLLTLIDEQLTMDLAKSEFDERLTIRHESVIPKDIRLQAEMDEAELRMGKVSINEVRERSGYEPIQGGEEPLVSVGLIPLSRVLEDVQGADPSAQEDPADDQALSAAVAVHRGALEAAGKRLACLFRSGARPTALALAAVPMIHLGFSAFGEEKATMEQTRRALRGVHLALERIRADRRSADTEKGKRLAITAFSAGLTIAHHDHKARRAS